MINFYKMHALGNDFVVIDGIQQKINPHKKWITALAHRHTGIGFDQLLLILPSQKADLSCEIYNQDGSKAEQCGNGMRCVAYFSIQNQLILKNHLTIETAGGIVYAKKMENDLIQIKLNFSIKNIKFLTLTLPTFSQTFSICYVSIGNPHAIVWVNSLENFPVSEIGAAISHHPIFETPVNVGFAQKINENMIRLKTFERGVGETLSCGSNACAAVIAGVLEKKLSSQVSIELPLGKLDVLYSDSSIDQIGPAQWVFKGSILTNPF